jgi:hypothetical protein
VKIERKSRIRCLIDLWVVVGPGWKSATKGTVGREDSSRVYRSLSDK